MDEYEDVLTTRAIAAGKLMEQAEKSSTKRAKDRMIVAADMLLESIDMLLTPDRIANRERIARFNRANVAVFEPEANANPTH